MPNKNEDKYYVERHEDGHYTGTRGSAQRAGYTGPTQESVIDQITKNNPDAPILVERQRHTPKGSPDKWRKP
jgi:hypothetical protein